MNFDLEEQLVRCSSTEGEERERERAYTIMESSVQEKEEVWSTGEELTWGCVQIACKRKRRCVTGRKLTWGCGQIACKRKRRCGPRGRS